MAALRSSWYQQGLYLPETLPQLMAKAARRYPRAQAVFTGDGHSSLADLETIDARARAVAGGLAGAGVGPGDRVAVQLPNWIEGLITVQAVLYLGAVAVPVVHIYGPAELGFVLRESGARVLVLPDRWRNVDYLQRVAHLGEVPSLETVVVVGDEVPSGFVPWSALESAGRVADPAAVTDPDAVCVVLYTSGTTADPKGVCHTHNTLGAQIRTSGPRLGIGPDTVSLAAFPAGHMAGLLSHIRMALAGSSTVWMDRWDADEAAALVQSYGVTTTSGAPTHLISLLDSARDTKRDISSLTTYLVGAASVSPTLVERAQAMGIAAFRSYGSTEHPVLSTGCGTDSIHQRAFTDGRLVTGNEARIVDAEGTDVGPGEDGELVCRGPQQFVGYTDPSLNEDSYLTDRWFRTGDIARLDQHGFLTITDRMKDVIIRGGETLSSKAIEDVLATMPAVAESAVVGAPDQRLGETVCAFVVVRPGSLLDLESVAQHFRAAGVARQKTPERLELVENFPRTASGKVQKFALRAQLRGGAAAT